MSYRVILIHGFFRDYKDMNELEENLVSIGYKVENLNFPLTFPKLEMSIDILRRHLLEIKNYGFNKEEEIILIGYGFGGVLIKETLKDKLLKGIVDKIILISSPINDSTLHRRLKRVFFFLDYIFKPLSIYSKIKKDKIKFDKNIEVGLIIGTESAGYFGRWLGRYNDGYVTVRDAEIKNANDKILIPIPHREIHKKIGTARYINNFISKGKFRLE